MTTDRAPKQSKDTHARQRESRPKDESFQSDSALRADHASILHLQRTIGNQAVQRLVAQDTPLIQRDPNPATATTEAYPTWLGEIHGTWLAALRKTPHKDPDDPHGNTLADLPPGTSVRVVGKQRGWLRVEVYLDGKFLTGYVSHELVNFVRHEQLVITQEQLDEAFKDLEHIGVEKAFVILKRAEMAKASNPSFTPDAKLADQIETAIWVLEGSGRWVINPQTYQVTLKQEPNQKIKLQTIEDFILFVEAVERQYPTASPREIASEIRQMWFASDTWEAMLSSRGIKNVDIETEPNPIARMFDMKDLAPGGNAESKKIETPLGKVDISHVMTGIDGALSGSPKGSGFKTEALRKANNSDPRDFVTWSGDLGQAYAQYLFERWALKNERVNLQQFVDEEADQEQLLGDIHGYIAYQVWYDVPGNADPAGSQLKVSNILRTLYLVNKEEAGVEKRSYQDYLEKVSGQQGDDLKSFIVERTLKFAPFEFAKVGLDHRGYWGSSGWTKEGIFENSSNEFEKHHQKNENEASEEDKLGGLIDSFMEMLKGQMR